MHHPLSLNILSEFLSRAMCTALKSLIAKKQSASVFISNMERYIFILMCPGGSENGKWIKLSLGSEEVASLTMDLLLLASNTRKISLALEEKGEC